MPHPRYVEAAEISHRSAQGTLRPFFVRDTQGDMYVVKGVDGAGAKALTAELLCAELGRRCGLPIADYALMTFPRGMLEFSTIDGASELEGGPAFASKVVPYCRELTYEQLAEVPTELQQRVLLFDMWVCNDDRNLSDQGGNVNLLLDADGELVVIDHNLAFDPIDPLIGEASFNRHVFQAQRHALHDLEVWARHTEALDSALADWDTITDFLPEEWVYRDPDDPDTEFLPTLADRYAWLQRLHEPTFWRDL
ncbi:HipA family kinase [Halomonas smyrnensis]|uniref:HipA family kinase n=1 Tax=Halomonas smyrnensis TaxID=720605 RepID=UPI00031BA69E|nr:HipA family kinase [Halomonas smyrnensis]